MAAGLAVHRAVLGRKGQLGTRVQSAARATHPLQAWVEEKAEKEGCILPSSPDDQCTSKFGNFFLFSGTNVL